MDEFRRRELEEKDSIDICKGCPMKMSTTFHEGSRPLDQPRRSSVSPGFGPPIFQASRPSRSRRGSPRPK